MTPTPTIRADIAPNEGHSTVHKRAFNFIAALSARDPAMPLGAILVLLYLYENRDAPHGVTLRQLRTDLKMTSTMTHRSLYYWKEDTISVQIDPSDRRGRT